METFRKLNFIMICLTLVNLIHSTDIDCNGRGFYCSSNTTFLICVDMGNNKTLTVDDNSQECPQGSFCSNTGQFECDSTIQQFPETTKKSIIVLSTNALTTTTNKNIETTTQKETKTSTNPITTKKSTPLQVTNIVTTKKPKLTTVKSIETTKKIFVTTRKTPPVIITTRKSTIKPNITTSKPICQESKYYRDEKSCHYYYVCIGRKLEKFYCPFNTVFDPNELTCSHNLKVCSNTFQCKSIGKFADAKFCQAYFECIKLGTQFNSLRIICPFFMSYVSAEKRCVLGPRGCSFIDDYMDQL